MPCALCGQPFTHHTDICPNRGGPRPPKYASVPFCTIDGCNKPGLSHAGRLDPEGRETWTCEDGHEFPFKLRT